MALTMLPFTVLAAPLKGEGTQENPYTIGTAEELKAFRDEVNAGENFSGQYVVLTADIVLNNEEFDTIGPTSDLAFAGTFDGCCYEITGLYSTNRGLFGYLNGTVRNLGVRGEVPYSGDYAGGVVARNNSGLVENCYSYVDVSCTATGAGGVVGYNGSDGTVRNCYHNGTVYGSSYAGGVAGQSYGTVENCYHLGNVSASSTGRAGGIVGIGGNTANSYSVGEVSGARYLGGAVGSLSGTPTVQGVFYDSEAYTGAPEAIEGVTGLAAEQFKVLEAFTGWDFDGVWKMSAALGRPVLRSVPEDTGAGTQEDPYIIPNKAALEDFRDSVNGGKTYAGEYVVVTADINLYGSEDAQWTPIGSSANRFLGAFDGGSHEIHGLYINDTAISTGNYKGLFGYLGEGGMIQNISVSPVLSLKAA